MHLVVTQHEFYRDTGGQLRFRLVAGENGVEAFRWDFAPEDCARAHCIPCPVFAAPPLKGLVTDPFRVGLIFLSLFCHGETSALKMASIRPDELRKMTKRWQVACAQVVLGEKYDPEVGEDFLNDEEE